ncbi:MAG: tRNA preQ1(34) S-adenosylmethionine ribosyltransferase-isomerase QueA [Minwuia sp.]|uniref:tRNA preQ1(34) S-adenosylmethionine ribosyltransferase-isomerase QueA n=1 Tax=Minwuia sp. TaxID=2493630 RepID=UPI003A83ED40
MKVDLFDFDLPEERIALRPAEPRESARLLDVGPGGLADRTIADLPDILEPGDLLVANDTKVIPARLKGRRGEARIEATLHMRLDGSSWAAFARPAKRLREGDTVIFDGLTAEVAEKREAGEVVLRFDRGEAELMAALHAAGEMPLPPYIASKRPTDERDRTDYQTVLADREGAVAAPTAGLHLTEALLAKLAAKGVELARLTLHVGAGTFLPVKADDTDDHRMHAEIGEITAETADRINGRTGRLIAVGTTSLRLLESAADDSGRVQPFSGATDIFITPGVRVRTADMLLTNFHLPRSTLFMLVSAFSGLERMHSAYAHAIETGYRFYSYGDACLLHRVDA